MTLLFWFCAFVLAYPLFIYPLLLEICCRWQGKKISPPTSMQNNVPPSLPAVSILLSVYNEAANIQKKIDNFLALDYPPDSLELLIVSDGSDDGTDAIAASNESERIRLLRQEGRLGKTAALNLAATQAKGEVLFFTDADSMLAPNAVTLLVRPLYWSLPDPSHTPGQTSGVGLTSGRSVYRDACGTETTGSVYRQYEEWQKTREGRLWGISGADGAAYAMKKDLYTPLPPQYINDLLHPIQVILAGQSAITLPDALVHEEATEHSPATEFSRQTRIMAQSWRIFCSHVYPLVQARQWGFIWQFVSHKPLRWLSLPAMILLGVSSVSLLPAILPMLALLSLTTICLCAWLGLKGKAGLPGRICLLFMLQGLAALNGLWHYALGNTFTTWKPRGK